MRISNSLLLNTSLRNYRSSSERMYELNQQIATKMKIQNSYEDTSTYIDAMRLNHEITTLEQSSASGTKAEAFANNTDKTLNSISSALEQFKTKLTQASSSVNSTTSLQALAKELKGIRDNLVSLSNTSINGQFLFSGSALTQKPISSDGTYKGNNGSLTALVGSGIELPYNIDGKSLFLGKDSDYSKVISTNVAMLNQSKLHPDIMTKDSQNETASSVYLTENDTIRDMIGDTNNSSTDDAKAVFYLSGRKSNGTTFSNVLKIDTTSKVSDLLDSIGQAYGNTATSKVVDVSMNVRGQIEVKDLTTGHQTLEMNIFGAIDRTAIAGQTGDAEQLMNIDNLTLHPNVDIIAFNKSNYNTSLSSPDLVMHSNPTLPVGNNSITFPYSPSQVTATTSLKSLFPSDVDHVEINGTRFPAAPASFTTETVNDLLTQMNGMGMTTSLNGNQIITDTVTTIVPFNSSNAIAQGNALPDAMNYARRGFEKDGNELLSNVSQVVKSTNEYATASTKLVDVAGVSSLNGKQLVLNFTDKNGVSRTGTLNLDGTNTTFSIDLNQNGTTNQISVPPVLSDDLNETIPIYNGKGDYLNSATKADDMTYQQLLDIVGMVTSGNIPKKGVNEYAQTAINDAITNSLITPATPVSIAAAAAATATAKSGVSTETAAYIQQAIDAGILKNDPTSSADVIAKATIDYNKAIANANAAEYNYALSTSKNSVEATLDYKGRINIIDKKASESKINFTMYDKSATDFTGVGSTALSFMANDSVTIENPSIDLFKQLDEIIAAVETGNLRMDANSSDPRNIGIQNALSVFDHIADHVTKEHTRIGAFTNAITDSNERVTMLSVNVKTVQNSVITADPAATYLELQSVKTSYEAMLSTIAEINKMSLLNYM